MNEHYNQKMLLIINPVSGKKQILRELPQVIRIFMDAGYLVTTMVTSERGDATMFVEQYGSRFDRIVCAGGDGTLSELILGLLNRNLSIPVGYIPCGSTNDFAVSHELSMDIQDAAHQVAFGEPHSIDVGLFEDRCFSYVAAFGAFSSLSYSTDQNLKNIMGYAAYLLGGLKELSMIKPLPLQMTVDGILYEGEYIFGAVCNTLSIAGTLELPYNIVDMSDGMMDLLLVRMPEDLIELDEVIHGLLEQDYSSPLLELVHAKEITVVSPTPLNWALDGEDGGAYETVRIGVSPGFLNLCF